MCGHRQPRRAVCTLIRDHTIHRPVAAALLQRAAMEIPGELNIKQYDVAAIEIKLYGPKKVGTAWYLLECGNDVIGSKFIDEGSIGRGRFYDKYDFGLRRCLCSCHYHFLGGDEPLMCGPHTILSFVA